MVFAPVAELVYAHGLEPCPERVAGSNPARSTLIRFHRSGARRFDYCLVHQPLKIKDNHNLYVKYYYSDIK